VSGLKPAHGLRRAGENGPQAAARHPTTCSRPDGRLGHGLVARPSRAEEAARDGRKRGARRARSRGGHRVELTRAPARSGLAGGKVLPASTGGVPGWRRAGEVEAGLTLAAAQREGGKRRRRRRGGGRRRRSGCSDEWRGGPAALAEAREVVAARRRSGEGKIAVWGGGIRPAAPFQRGAAGRGPWKRWGQHRGSDPGAARAGRDVAARQ
jgi:hypothetical protein